MPARAVTVEASAVTVRGEINEFLLSAIISHRKDVLQRAVLLVTEIEFSYRLVGHDDPIGGIGFFCWLVHRGYYAYYNNVCIKGSYDEPMLATGTYTYCL